MLTLGLGTSVPVSSVLCLGAHSDDIEIGCGGTILKLLAASGQVSVDWIVFSADGDRALEAQKGADAFLARARTTDVRVEQFRGSYFPYMGSDIKGYFDQLGATLRPDVIFTHQRDDLHQDHRLISELTLNTFRNHLILEYEIPKYDGDLGRTNAYVHLDRETCERKIQHIAEVFASQHDKHWFSPETFRATLRLRGVEARSPEGYAEGFYCRKLVLA